MRFVSMTFCGALVCLAAGCSGPTTGVLRGQVTYDGQPLSTGTITVACEDGRVASGNIRKDGTYNIPNAPAGPVHLSVAVPPPAPVFAAIGKEGAKIPDAKELKEMQQAQAKYVPLPPRYQDAKTSGLNTTVEPGEQTYDIALTK